MQVAVGDVVPLDRDANGDRGHTAAVSRTVAATEAAHGGRGVVHYWHLLT